jgi:hypothetical protein
MFSHLLPETVPERSSDAFYHNNKNNNNIPFMTVLDNSNKVNSGQTVKNGT